MHLNNDQKVEVESCLFVADEGNAINENTDLEKRRASSPVNLGHLLKQKALPFPTNNDNALFCPASQIPVGKPPSEGFIGKWDERHSEAAVTYMFNTSLDGVGNQFYPETALQTGSIPFFSHKTVANYLLGDGSTHAFKLQKRVFPSCDKSERLYDFHARTGVSSPPSMIHQWFEEGDVDFDQMTEFYNDPQAWITDNALLAQHKPVLLDNVASRSLVADVISVVGVQKKDTTRRRG